MKKIWNVIKSIFTWLLVVAAASMMIFTIVSVNFFDHTDRSLFGYKAFVVLSDSMSKTDFNAGDIVLMKEVDPATLQPGDIISFQSTSSDNYGEIITHKIRRLTTDTSGAPAFVTYGTTTDTDDVNVVTYPFVLGKYETHIPKLGTFFLFLKTTPGYIVCIFLPFLLLILSQGYNSVVLFKRYKAEQMEALEEKRAAELAEMTAERERLEAERAESRKMMEQLMAMQAQMAQNQQPGAAETSDQPAEE